MKLTEKMSYLQGLMDGLEIDESTKEGKALVKISEVVSELVLYVEDLQSQVDELTELCDILDEDLGAVENDFYEDEEPDCGTCGGCYDDEDEDFDFDDNDFGFGDDDELYEVTCPTCGDTILVTDAILEEGEMNCPNCDELLEFDYDNLTFEEFENEKEPPKKDGE